MSVGAETWHINWDGGRGGTTWGCGQDLYIGIHCTHDEGEGKLVRLHTGILSRGEGRGSYDRYMVEEQVIMKMGQCGVGVGQLGGGAFPVLLPP